MIQFCSRNFLEQCVKKKCEKFPHTEISMFSIDNIMQIILYNYWLVMRATYDMLDLNTKCCLKDQHITCCPNPKSIIVLLYIHWFRIMYSIQTIHKQTDHEQTGPTLDELIWDELALVWINSYTITPVQCHPGCEQQIDITWNELVSDKVDSELACDVKRVIVVQHLFLYALGPTLIFICPLLWTWTIGII